MDGDARVLAPADTSGAAPAAVHADRTGSATTATRSWPPYPPSPFDRAIDRIEALPGGGWWLYVAVIVALAVLVEAYRWLVLEVPVGQLKGAEWAFVIYGPYFMALAQYLDRTASNALDRFRPALDRSEADVERLRYELTTLPPRPTVAAFLAGALFGVLAVAVMPDGVVGAFFPGPRAQSILLIGAIAIANFGVTGIILYHTARQLRMVTRIHAEARHIDLHRPAPLYAFSGLTARTGIGYAALAYLSVMFFSFLYETAGGGLLVVADLSLVIAAAACFVLPLVGIHNRLSVEKARLIAEADDRLASARITLYERVDSGQLHEVDQLDHAITALTTIRDRTARLSTWPWEPAVFRGFVTALLLPLTIWVITRVADRAFT